MIICPIHAHSQVVELVVLKALRMVHEPVDLVLLKRLVRIVILPLQTVFVLVFGLLLAHLKLFEFRRPASVLFYDKFVLAGRLHLIVYIDAALFSSLLLLIRQHYTVFILLLRIVFGQLG